jgi:hypothetical protein
MLMCFYLLCWHNFHLHPSIVVTTERDTVKGRRNKLDYSKRALQSWRRNWVLSLLHLECLEGEIDMGFNLLSLKWVLISVENENCWYVMNIKVKKKMNTVLWINQTSNFSNSQIWVLIVSKYNLGFFYLKKKQTKVKHMKSSWSLLYR